MVSDNVIVEGFDESEVLRQLLGQGTILEQSGAALQTEHEVKRNMVFMCHTFLTLYLHCRLFKILIQNTLKIPIKNPFWMILILEKMMIMMT